MDVKTLGVVGCGLMGSGIAEVAALAGLDVVVVKATAGALEQAIARVEGSLDRAVAKGKLAKEARDAARARITFSADFEPLRRCDLVIESTAETLASKKRILVEIEQAVNPGAIVATNTSSLPLQQLAAVFKSPERFLGLHFFSPVPAMKLVEVARLGLTAQDVVAAACLLVERLGKTPILLGDEPGYVVNRLLVPYLCQAIDMLEQGVARAQDIDGAMKLGCGSPARPARALRPHRARHRLRDGADALERASRQALQAADASPPPGPGGAHREEDEARPVRLQRRGADRESGDPGGDERA